MLTTTSRQTVAAYVTGLVATCAGIAYTAIDQFAVQGLDRRLHDLYDPVGKSAEAGALYTFLYAMGALGVLTWSLCLRWVRRGHPKARARSTWTLVLATIVVATPVAFQEYGQPVIPWSLMIAWLVAWVAGVAGTTALWFGRGTNASATTP